MSFWLLFLFATFSFGARNVQINRKIDIRSHVLRINTEIVAEDVENHNYHFEIDPSETGSLAFISATSTVGAENVELPVSKVGGKSNGNVYTINLDKVHGTSKHFTVLTVYTESFHPMPSEILQAEKQFVKYNGNMYYYSHYETVAQDTSVIIPRSEVSSYTEESHVSKSSEKIVYGPYKNVPARSKRPFFVHYESGSPFLLVTSMTRLIEISHWGNIAVEETYDVVNYGAKLKGPFSRLDYQTGIGHQAAVRYLRTSLPASARDIYYRDEIGNVSTSTVRERFDSVEVELMPRFPLMGGWKTQYTLGYNIPAYEFLYRKNELFALRMRMVDHIYDNQVVAKLTLKVVLPEAVSNIEFKPPFPVSSHSMEVTRTYLDTTGRPVIVVTAENLVDEHIQEFTVAYNFSLFSMIREPLMVVTAFLVLFAVLIIYTRLDFSIYRDEKGDIRLRTQTIIEEIQSVQDQRLNAYQSYEDVAATFKSGKNLERFHNEKRKVETEHKGLNQKLATLQTKLAEYYGEGVEKMNELQALDQRYRDLAQESALLAERLVSGKLTKLQYQSTDGELNSKKGEIIQRMEVLMENI